MDIAQYVGPASAPVIVALVAVINKALLLDKRWSPVLAIALGVAWNVGARLAGISAAQPGEAVLWGIISGLLASGLFSVGKTALGR